MPAENTLYYRQFSLPTALSEVVKYGWIMRSQEPAPSVLDLLIPDGYPEIIFVLQGEYYKRKIVVGSGTETIAQSCVVGVQRDSVLANRGSYCHLLGLKLYPWGAYRLLGSQLGSLANRHLYLDDLGIGWLTNLDAALQATTEGEASKISTLIAVLQQQLLSSNKNNRWQQAKTYLKTILDSGGQLRVQTLADEHHLSVRQLQRKFKQYYGVSPKQMIRLIRFKQLYKASVLQEQLPSDFLDYGYYDQMHFIKDFYQQLGVTPSKATQTAFLQLNNMAKRNVRN